MEGVVDNGTNNHSQTLHIGHASPSKIPWRSLGQCELFVEPHRQYRLTDFYYLLRLDKYRVLEDGSQTQYRLCVIESLIPPHSDGPVFHFHEMHDEGFYVTVRAPFLPVNLLSNPPHSHVALTQPAWRQKGKVRFHSPGRGHLDAGPGDLVTVPIRLPHKFSNPFDEEAVFINTITPGFFVRYFEYLEEMIGQGTTLTPEVNMAALKRFATVPLTDDMIKQFEAVYASN